MHAWLSGQLARAWGNPLFGEVTPSEEVFLAAEQHDSGHIAWEQAPTLNPQTNLPYSFLEMPRLQHLQIWSRAARLVLPQGRYAALLVSLHGTGLYEHYNAATDTAEQVQAVQDYLTRERAFQEEMLASLRADSYYRAYASAEVVLRNQRLVRTWDALSLAICSGRARPGVLQQVPAATGTTTLTLTMHEGNPAHLIVTPWPFRFNQVSLVYEGRLLTTTFSDEKTLHEALQHASWITLQTTLSADPDPYR
jgi:hypothetical protein